MSSSSTIFDVRKNAHFKFAMTKRQLAMCALIASSHDFYRLYKKPMSLCTHCPYETIVFNSNADSISAS